MLIKKKKNSYHRDEEISSTSFFHKSYPLSPTVTLSMSIEVLLAVEYKIADIVTSSTIWPPR